MEDRIFVEGNEAVGSAAVAAGCTHFFGYPITPQNIIPEWFSRELPKLGGVYLQAQCETGAINMVYGAAATGARVLISTSGPGWALMMETLSNLSAVEMPCVIVQVQRGGIPGWASVMHAQTDYFGATRGGAGGDYRNIVLAPASVQETYDFVQLAFYLADKYRNPVIILTDAIIGQMREPLAMKTLDFGSLPEKDWAVKGMAHHKDGERRMVDGAACVRGYGPYGTVVDLARHLYEKFNLMKSEIKYEIYGDEDAELFLVAYGYSARVCIDAVDAANKKGMKVGLIRPMTLWPFPYEIIKEKAEQGADFLVVEDSLGQLIEDVKLGAEGCGEIHFIGILARHLPTMRGMLLPGKVFEEIETVYKDRRQNG